MGELGSVVLREMAIFLGGKLSLAGKDLIPVRGWTRESGACGRNGLKRKGALQWRDQRLCKMRSVVGSGLGLGVEFGGCANSTEAEGDLRSGAALKFNGDRGRFNGGCDETVVGWGVRFLWMGRGCEGWST